MNHTGDNCPICKKEFTDNDDVVVCPFCGAPYHRECYQSAGACVFEEKHASGFEYISPVSAKKPDIKQPSEPTPTKGIICKQCQTVNESSNIFCEHCGATLHAPVTRPNSTKPAGSFFNVFFGGSSAGVDTSGEIEGISYQEWSTFFGQNAPFYLNRIQTMKSLNRPISFMFSAFFIGPFYFAYRKIWNWAAICLAANFILAVPQYVLIAANVDVFLLPFLSMDTLNFINSISTYLLLASQLLFGIFSVHIYKNHAKKHILSLREKGENDATYYMNLSRAGGISVIGALIVLALMLVFSFAFIIVVSILGGPDALTLLANSY